MLGMLCGNLTYETESWRSEVGSTMSELRRVKYKEILILTILIHYDNYLYSELNDIVLNNAIKHILVFI
jgi:hypothetical protein